MSTRNATTWRTALALALAAASLEADALRIPAGHDLFTTAADGRTYFYLGGNRENPIPAGFFGCVPSKEGCLPSDPVESPIRVTFEGLATGDLGLEPSSLDNSPCKNVSDADKFGVHCADGVSHYTSTNPNPLADVDTIVLRQADLVFEALGEVRSAPIELVSLSLRSINPIEIRYGNGRLSQRFHVTVKGPRTRGSSGTMVVKRTGESSGTYYSTLPVSGEISFQNTTSSGPSAVGPIELDLNFASTEIPWKFIR